VSFILKTFLGFLSIDKVTVCLKPLDKELQTGFTACVSSFNYICQTSIVTD